MSTAGQQGSFCTFVTTREEQLRDLDEFTSFLHALVRERHQILKRDLDDAWNRRDENAKKNLSLVEARAEEVRREIMRRGADVERSAAMPSVSSTQTMLQGVPTNLAVLAEFQDGTKSVRKKETAIDDSPTLVVPQKEFSLLWMEVVLSSIFVMNGKGDQGNPEPRNDRSSQRPNAPAAVGVSLVDSTRDLDPRGYSSKPQTNNAASGRTRSFTASGGTTSDTGKEAKLKTPLLPLPPSLNARGHFASGLLGHGASLPTDQKIIEPAELYVPGNGDLPPPLQGKGSGEDEQPNKAATAHPQILPHFRGRVSQSMQKSCPPRDFSFSGLEASAVKRSGYLPSKLFENLAVEKLRHGGRKSGYNIVKVTHFLSPSEFFVAFKDDAGAHEAMRDALARHRIWSPDYVVAPGFQGYVNFDDGRDKMRCTVLKRVQVPGASQIYQRYLVRLCDVGAVIEIPASCLCGIQECLQPSHVPPLAVRCHLPRIRPVKSDQWAREDTDKMKRLLALNDEKWLENPLNVIVFKYYDGYQGSYAVELFIRAPPAAVIDHALLSVEEYLAWKNVARPVENGRVWGEPEEGSKASSCTPKIGYHPPSKRFSAGDEVRCRVIYSKGPGRFFVRELSTLKKGTAMEADLGEFYEKLMGSVEFFAWRYMLPKSGGVCAWKDVTADSWRRAEIVKVTSPTEIRVLLVDVGREIVVNADCLFKLPEKFCRVPKLAVECSLHDVVPLKGEVEFSKAARKEFQRLTHKKHSKIIVCGLIKQTGEGELSDTALSVGLPTDDDDRGVEMIYSVRCRSLDERTGLEVDIVAALADKGLVRFIGRRGEQKKKVNFSFGTHKECSGRLKKTSSATSGVATAADLLTSVCVPLRMLLGEAIDYLASPVARKSHRPEMVLSSSLWAEVVVMHIVDPGLMYVRFEDETVRAVASWLESELMRKFSELRDSPDKEPPEEGGLCLVKHPDSGRVYRGRVTKISSAGEEARRASVDVSLIDTGENVRVRSGVLVRVGDEHRLGEEDLPSLALKVGLVGVTPAGSDVWTQSAKRAVEELLPPGSVGFVSLRGRDLLFGRRSEPADVVVCPVEFIVSRRVETDHVPQPSFVTVTKQLSELGVVYPERDLNWDPDDLPDMKSWVDDFCDALRLSAVASSGGRDIETAATATLKLLPSGGPGPLGIRSVNASSARFESPSSPGGELEPDFVVHGSESEDDDGGAAVGQTAGWNGEEDDDGFFLALANDAEEADVDANRDLFDEVAAEVMSGGEVGEDCRWPPPAPITVGTMRARFPFFHEDGSFFFRDVQDDGPMNEISTALVELFGDSIPPLLLDPRRRRLFARGRRCAARYFGDGLWHRATVVSVLTTEQLAKFRVEHPYAQGIDDNTRVVVEFVDFGERAFCKFDEVRGTEDFSEVPAKAYRARLHGVEVVKKEFAEVANDAVSLRGTGTVEIVGSTSGLYEVIVRVAERDLREVLVEKNVVRWSLPYDGPTYCPFPSDQNLDNLPVRAAHAEFDEESSPRTVTVYVTPELVGQEVAKRSLGEADPFPLQMMQYKTDLMRIEELLFDLPEAGNFGALLKKGTPCVAEFFDVPFRAEVVEHQPDGRVKVFFVDYGNTETVDPKTLRAVPENFVRPIPRLVLECRMPVYWNAEVFVDATKKFLLSLENVDFFYVKFHKTETGDRFAQFYVESENGGRRLVCENVGEETTTDL